ncbi:MAG: N-acetylmuramoyl-L-alanine amidase, partial [Flavobacteriales bacterium]|nr:N-acetylmuramoyl-L-alanine amidase [Flavobacteriales bacterium]
GFVFSNATFSRNKSDFFGVKTVCIDAGHGGHDPGCHGLSSKEKHVALAMALKLGKHIEENFPDVKVVYTRKTDVYLKLWERAAIANKAKADLFICIHANANDNKAAYGTETYVMGLHKSESNLNVAKRENSSILLEEDYKTKYSDFDPNSPESYIVLTMRQDAFIDQSLSFASKIQKQFKERVGRKDRGVKQAGFLVLHQTNMPSVLIETGFLTNREEEKFLVSDVGQDYLSSAIYRAFKEYKKELESKDGVTENIVDEKEEIKKPKEVVVKEVKPKTKEQIKKEKKDKKINKGEVIAKGVVFKVQLATSSKKLELLPQNFKGIKNVEIYNAGGLYRYVVGKETNITDANSLQLRIRNKGYKDAFIIAFSDGKRISVSAALNLLK